MNTRDIEIALVVTISMLDLTVLFLLCSAVVHEPVQDTVTRINYQENDLVRPHD